MDNLEINSDDDSNLSDSGNIQDAFPSTYHLDTEVFVGGKCKITNNLYFPRPYVLHLNGSRTSNNKIAVALSDQSCVIYDREYLKDLETLIGHKGTVTNIKFSPCDDHIVYSSSLDGRIKLWDLRLKTKDVLEFKDDTDESQKLKPITDFDVSCHGCFLSGGTELVNDDAYILFWDTRSTKLLGGYWESHTDDVTQVIFHSQKEDLMASGSVDGLINVFDISKPSEDDALLHSLNTESSVQNIKWMQPENGIDILSCITHTHELQLWKTDGSAPFLYVSRNTLSKSMLRKNLDDCFPVNVHERDKPDGIFLLAGCTPGNGKCLQTLVIHKDGIRPMSNFIGNKQIVRASYFDKENDILITGGEGGMLSLWKREVDLNSVKDHKSELKIDSSQKFKHHRKKPY